MAKRKQKLKNETLLIGGSADTVRIILFIILLPNEKRILLKAVITNIAGIPANTRHRLNVGSMLGPAS